VIPPPGSTQSIRQIALYARYSKKGDFSTATLIETRPFADTVHFSVEQSASVEYTQYYLTYVNPENQESVPDKKQPVSLRLVKKKNGVWALD
jgi:hypothetical protein